MWSRLLLWILGAFWALMSLFLWRSEFAGSPLSSTPVDPSLVWSRILTSPDSSSMAIIHSGKRVGFCHLITSVADSLDHASHTNAPEGLVRNISNYKLDLSGSMQASDEDSRIRFDGEMMLSENQEWEDFRLQIIERPLFITATAKRTEGRLHLTIDSAEFSFDRSFRFEELSRPESILSELLGAAAPLALNALSFSLPETRLATATQQMQWSASTDRFVIGNSATQIYRLQLTLMEGYEIVILVSRAGEILRIELTQNLTLVNEALTGL